MTLVVRCDTVVLCCVVLCCVVLCCVVLCCVVLCCVVLHVQGVWAYSQGGMGTVSGAIAKSAQVCGMTRAPSLPPLRNVACSCRDAELRR
jgi:hypothetical protein